MRLNKGNGKGEHSRSQGMDTPSPWVNTSYRRTARRSTPPSHYGNRVEVETGGHWRARRWRRDGKKTKKKKEKKRKNEGEKMKTDERKQKMRKETDMEMTQNVEVIPARALPNHH